MTLNEEQLQQARDRIGRLFKFLQELHRVRTPPIVNLEQYDWHLPLPSLPRFPTISIGEAPSLDLNESEQVEDKEDNFILRIKRPVETACPKPPASIQDWLKPGWQQLEAEVETLRARNRVNKDGKTVVEEFSEDPEREQELAAWILLRKNWQEAEGPAREALAVFSDFFELWGKFQREAEQLQLYLGDGQLLWNHPNGTVHHPVLLQKVQLDFDPSVPEFVIRESESQPELNTGLLRYFAVDGAGLHQCREMVKREFYHPLEKEKTSGFLRHIIQRLWQDGEFFEIHQKNRMATSPCIYRSPILYLGYRNQGFVEAIDGFLEALPGFPELPEPLVRLVGFDTRADQKGPSSLPDDPKKEAASEKKLDLLLTKAANPEQERVIQRLESVGSVLVQGPPGTGKSHTIANLIGHLLAENKTILVSSQTSKALKVVREKVAEPIQPLCVSVLDSDGESRKQLEQSVSGIVNYFSHTDKTSLQAKIKDLAQKRDQLKKRQEDLEQALLQAMREEYTDIVIAGEGTPPAQAARKLVDYKGVHDWIPGPVEEGRSLPLSQVELSEVYASNHIITIDDEKVLLAPTPEIEQIPTSDEFSHWIEEITHIEGRSLDVDSAAWTHHDHTVEVLSHAMDTAMTAAGHLYDGAAWQLECIESGRKGGVHRETWDTLLKLITSTRDEIAKRKESILALGPNARSSKTTKDQIRICSEIVQLLESGGKLNFISTLFKPEWKEFIESASVDQGAPKTAEDFKAIRSLLEVQALRDDLKRRWDRQMASLGQDPLPDHEGKPEEVAHQYVEKITYALGWYPGVWAHCEITLQEAGINWNYIHQKVPPNPSPLGEILRLRDAIFDHLGNIIETKRSRIAWEALQQIQRQWVSYLDSFSEKEASFSLVSTLRKSISNRDIPSYTAAWRKLNELHRLGSAFKKRQDLLKKLDTIAPGWSLAIRNRTKPHDQSQIPGDPAMAWKYRQWEQVITRRNQSDSDALQRDLNAAKEQLQDITAQYVEKLAWSAQADRTKLREQQSLNGWLGIQKRIGAGTGKRVPILRAEARRLLRECRSAVPVWIMPLSRVMENFDLAKTRFNVVILDEASQSDVLGLIAFALGKEVVVVGDDEQVSPYGIGQQVMAIQALINEFLKDIPNRQLYDGKTSVYDLARHSFGGTIRLLEHFRCVPDIIQFSNFLCYNGEIKALREANSTHLYPHLVSYRVTNGLADNKVNEREALQVAALVAAICEMPEYSKSSIGVISLVGTDQALKVDAILQKRLSISEYQNRKILCGNASQFQGDERDVMILSVVDSPKEGPLRLRQSDPYRKIFNVAASRARDQLWVIHSLNPDTDLQSGDLRLRLIKHAEDPSALRKQYETGSRRTASEFERLTLGHLTTAGYQVVCQWEVGAYSIDMVVIGKEGRKVAIECDGDRYHPPEKLSEDMNRQMMLERLGWRFIRIRGSEFFRNQTGAMQRVCRRLSELGIEPIGAAPAAGIREVRSTELRDRVIRRADEIQLRWEETPEEPDPESSRKTRSRFSRKRKEADPEPSDN